VLTTTVTDGAVDATRQDGAWRISGIDTLGVPH
jgi:hypothetical protein